MMLRLPSLKMVVVMVMTMYVRVVESGVGLVRNERAHTHALALSRAEEWWCWLLVIERKKEMRKRKVPSLALEREIAKLRNCEGAKK